MEVRSIMEQLLFSTIRIESQEGKVGTGFILQARLNIGSSMIFLITNKHVVENSDRISFFFTKSNSETPPKNSPLIGEKCECQIEKPEWFDHPDEGVDLTLINLSTTLTDLKKKGTSIFIRSIPLELIPNKEDLEKLDALENILFIGYPNGMYDSKNLFPIIRTGITATPIYSDYEGKPFFLIDASVFPGSSGSPVFIYDKTGYTDKKGNSYLGGERIIFCGVVSGTIIRKEDGEIKFVEIPTKITPLIQTNQMIDLGIVIKSEKVRELLDLYLTHLNEENRKQLEQKNG